MSNIVLLKELIYIFNKKEKIQSLFLFILLLLGVLADAFSISIILPFMAIILNPDMINKYQSLQIIYNKFGFRNHNDFVIIASITLLIFFILKSLFLCLLNYLQSRFIFNKQVSLSQRLLITYLYKPYSFYFERNTAELQRNINNSIPNIVSGVLLAAVNLITEFLVTVTITIILFIADPLSAAVVIVFLGGITALFYQRIHKATSENGINARKLFAGMIKWVNQGFGSIKETKVLGREMYFADVYTKNSRRYAKTMVYLNMTNNIPRFLIETVAVAGMISIIIINIYKKVNLVDLLPTLGLFAMAAYRIMPSLNRIFTYLNNINYFKSSVDDIYKDIYMENNQKLNNVIENNRNESTIKDKEFFNNEISISNLTYSYPSAKNKNVLNDVSLTIKKGKLVGFIGSSGAGKTTLIDLILGLLSPTSGNIFVDGKSISENFEKWRSIIGYIPQNIYLIDDTICRNIALGLPDDKIDIERINKVLEISYLKNFVDSLPNGINTIIGENGVCLSGGQRQRIGIARALYNDPEVLILDEATSALDNETEKEVMQAVDSLKGQKTLFIIAHRISTTKNCDEIYEIRDGKLNLKVF